MNPRYMIQEWYYITFRKKSNKYTHHPSILQLPNLSSTHLQKTPKLLIHSTPPLGLKFISNHARKQKLERIVLEHFLLPPPFLSLFASLFYCSFIYLIHLIRDLSLSPSPHPPSPNSKNPNLIYNTSYISTIANKKNIYNYQNRHYMTFLHLNPTTYRFISYSHLLLP